jgi:2-amino-4-hydroxy-6-hydroxymethyldihydropteridine diphosphokinase
LGDRLPDGVIAAIALGSNLGDRQAHLDDAIRRLSESLSSLRASSYIETSPVDMRPGAPAFLNAAVVGTTRLSAREVLDRLLAIEQDRGRERPYANAPRTLDLDLILFGDVITDEPGLILPHPRFRERRFVLAPLAEIGATLVDPVTRRSVAELLAMCRD